jgi:hypothetical protein
MPFCGRRERNVWDWRFVCIGDTNTTQVECQGCGARGPHCMTNPVVEKNADVLNVLTAWNERVGDGDRLSRVDSEAVQQLGAFRGERSESSQNLFLDSR